jgi:hypothetical protein
MIDGAVQADTYNSRILLDFSGQVASLATAIANGEIPPIGNGAGSSSVYLSLRASDATDLLISYSLNAYPISESWSNGNGNYNDIPEITNGVSWYFRTEANLLQYWNTGSAISKNQFGLTNSSGGGTWITGSTYEASQSFSFQSPDVRMNVTDIVKHWVNNDIANYGFIVKRPYSDEISSDVLGSLKFFSRETNTIYVPRIEVSWNDANLSGLSSVTAVSDNELYVPYIKNLRETYKETDVATLRVGARPEYPLKNYGTTESHYLTNYRLPSASYYCVKDAITEETLIPYDTNATQISCDTTGNYFKLRLNTFMPERYYKIVIKSIHDVNNVQIHDNGYYFKVIR